MANDRRKYDKQSERGRPRERDGGRRECPAPKTPADGAVIGRNAVRELLKSGRSIDKIFVRRGDREGSITALIGEAASKRIPIIEVDASKLDTMAAGTNHQGIIAMAAEKDYGTLDDIFAVAAERGEKPFIVIADDVTDPGNLGAIIRSAECAGCHGLIIPKRHSAGLTPAVSKSSAGAIEHLTIVKVPNLVAAVKELQERGVWIYTAEADGEPYYKTKFDSATAIILGSEGEGVSRVLREASDFIVSIPMYGHVNSLNVSCAGAVLLFEAARQLHE